MATHKYYYNLIADKYDELYDEIYKYMQIYSHLNFFSGSFDSLNLTSYSTTSDGLYIKKGHRNWFWANIFEDMSAKKMCFKKSIMSKNGRKVLINLYSATPFDDDVAYGRNYLYTNSLGLKINNAVNELFRVATNYVRCFPDVKFTTRIMRFAGGVASECTTENGTKVRQGHKNWLYYSLLEQLTADCILWKHRLILPGKKRTSVFYSVNPIKV